jgi:hypothetical protein
MHAATDSEEVRWVGMVVDRRQKGIMETNEKVNAKGIPARRLRS